jgi:hypothetical protein
MITQVWSRREILTEFLDCNDLKEVYTQLEKRLASEEMVLCDFIVNSEWIENEHVAQHKKLSLNEIEHIQVHYCHQSYLLHEMMMTFVGYIGELQKTSETMGQSMKWNADSETIREFTVYLESVDWFVEGLFPIQKVLTSRKGNEALQTKWQASEARFSYLLQQVMDNFQKKDLIQLADILEYDLSAEFVVWQSIIQELLDKKVLLDAQPEPADHQPGS